MQLGAVFSNSEVGADVGSTRHWAQALQDLGYDFAVAADHVVGADKAAYPELERVFPIENPLHEPLPAQRRIPVWIGAAAEAAVKRACVIAGGYLPLAPLEGGWQATMDKVHAWLAEAGRAPSSFNLDGRLNAQTGTPDDWIKTID